MNRICEDMIEECLNEFDEIDDEIYSESVLWLVDDYIDSHITECMSNIFTSDSETTVYDALSNFVSILNNTDDSGSDTDSDYSMTAIAPEVYTDDTIDVEDLRDEFVKDEKDKENINDDVVFEVELIKQIEINIDYILMLVEKFRASHGKDKTIIANIRTAINSSIELRSKKELIEGFIEDINVSDSVGEDWKRYVSERKEADLADLIQQERLKPEEARKFIDNAFRDGALKTIGTDIDKIMPPANPFDRKRGEKKKGIIERIKAFFEKYLGLV